MKKWILPLLLGLTLFFCGCEEAVVEIPFRDNYSMVRSDFREKAPMDAFFHLRDAFDALEAGITMNTDFISELDGQVAPDCELLVGYTERAETQAALAAFPLTERDWLVQVTGSKIVLLAGSTPAYLQAADWLTERYDPVTGMLTLPEKPQIGTWTPALDGLTLQDTPIGAYRIVLDDAYWMKLQEPAEILRDAIYNRTGVWLEIVSDETEPAAHEILLCTGAVNRTLPPDKTGLYFADGHLVLHGNTQPELLTLIERFTGFLTEEADTAITTDTLSNGGCMKDFTTQTISITGTTPEERGAALTAAMTEANTLLAAAADAPVELILELADGDYRLTEPVKLSGTSHSRLTIRPAEGAEPVITGEIEIPDTAFVQVEDQPYYVAEMPAGVPVRNLLSSGEPVPFATSEILRTKLPFADHASRADPANHKGIYVNRKMVESLGDLTNGSTEFTIFVEWEFARMHVVGVDWNDTQTVDGEELVLLQLEQAQMDAFAELSHVLLTIQNREYFFTNSLSLLTPGTCVCDYKNGLIYYYPAEGAPADMSYSMTEQLFSLHKAGNVTFEGITFTGTACLLDAKEGYLSGQANTEKRYGALQCTAVLLNTCENIRFTDCDFVSLGTNGIQSLNNLNGMVVENCRFRNVAMSAVALGNHEISWTSANASYNYRITENTLEHIGFGYPTATAVYISHVDGLTLTHNTIHHVAYSGISLGWGWSVVPYAYGEAINVRHAELAWNHITEFMTCLKDGAAIYVLGANCTEAYPELFNEMHHNFAQNPNSNHRGYYLDGSASNWYVHDNVISGAFYPLFTQFHVKDQYNHNVLCERIYSTDPIDAKNHAPERNVKLGDVYVAESLEALYEAHPEAAQIEADAGAGK